MSSFSSISNFFLIFLQFFHYSPFLFILLRSFFLFLFFLFTFFLFHFQFELHVATQCQVIQLRWKFSKLHNNILQQMMAKLKKKWKLQTQKKETIILIELFIFIATQLFPIKELLQGTTIVIVWLHTIINHSCALHWHLGVDLWWFRQWFEGRWV